MNREVAIALKGGIYLAAIILSCFLLFGHQDKNHTSPIAVGFSEVHPVSALI